MKKQNKQKHKIYATLAIRGFSIQKSSFLSILASVRLERAVLVKKNLRNLTPSNKKGNLNKHYPL
jgi:hypothetical protein